MEEMLAQARLALEDEVSETRERLREAARRLRSAPAASTLPAVALPAETTDDIGEAQAAVAAAEEQIAHIRPRRTRRRAGPEPSVEEIRAGDHVWLRGLEQSGEALSAPDVRGELDVQFGALRTRVKATQVARVVRASIPAQSVQVRVTQAPAKPTGISIEVRGQRAEETIPALEQFVENAFRAGLPFVRIIHGKGTGVLRRVVREQLTANPLVKSFETAALNDGGEGVTIAHLAH
jgi:DNA mismatch repair protein MutS2